jgi:BASS family bile acid:Na+ symporter
MDVATRLFPYAAALFAALAILGPESFLPLQPAIVPLLGVVMLGMGMTLTTEAFSAVARRPAQVAIGVALQFMVMPLVGWGLARALSLPPAVATGVILVGACPGGVASNVITYLARGDVALSVTLTSLSTVAAVALTPALTWIYAGQTVPVPVTEMLLSILQVVIGPVVLGVLLNRWLGARLDAVKALFPTVSVAAIVLIIAIIVAANRSQLAQVGPITVVAVMLHNLIGLAAGYWAARWLGQEERVCRTVAIEVGMQNSGLAVALASQHFSAAAALPGAIFSVWHNLAGASLAAHWARRGQRGLSGGTRAGAGRT